VITDKSLESRTHRKPLYRELFFHGVYATLLMLWMFALFDTQWAFQVGSVVDKRFVQQRMSTGKNFHHIVNFRDVVVWMNESLKTGMFDSDSDGSGSLFGYDRLVGGVELRYEHIEFIPPNPVAAAASGNFRDTLVREGERTFVQTYYINPQLGQPDVIDYALNETVLPRIVPGQLDEVINAVNDGWLRTPQSNEAAGWSCNCSSLMRELRVRFTLYNGNVELYVNAEYKFRQTEEGLVKASNIMRVYPMEPPWSDLPPKDGSETYRRLAVYLFGLYYLMVLVNSRTLFKAARKVYLRDGTIKYFLMNGWTLLQIFNNVNNYINLALCCIYSYYAQRRDWDPTSVTAYVDLTTVGELYSYINFIQAVAVFCSWVLFIHFFELAPQTSMWYVTSTALSRAGTSVYVAAILCVQFLLGFAVLANQVYGLRMLAFSTLFRSFISLVKLLMGDDSIYHEMATSRPNVGALVFLVVFLAIFYFMILPLFIAIMTDAYFLRQQINEELILHVQEKAIEKARATEKDRLRKRGGVH